MSSQIEELQGMAYMFFSPSSSLFPLPFPLFPLACVPLRAAGRECHWVCCIVLVFCWHWCHQKHLTCMWTCEQVLRGEMRVWGVELGRNWEE